MTMEPHQDRVFPKSQVPRATKEPDEIEKHIQRILHNSTLRSQSQLLLTPTDWGRAERVCAAAEAAEIKSEAVVVKVGDLENFKERQEKEQHQKRHKFKATTGGNSEVMANYDFRNQSGGAMGGGGAGGSAAGTGGDGSFGYQQEDGYRRGRPMHRRPVTDYGSSVAKYVAIRQMGWRPQIMNQLRPGASYIIDLLPPSAYGENPAMSLCTKHAHASLNKIKHPINVVKWTPEGRRLLTGSSSGEFTLWNGMGFNFETIMQAHDCAIRVCQYSHGDDWLLSGDQDGIVKYWQPNFNNVKVLQAHTEPIRDLSFSPTDAKFVTASDDGTLRIWNFNEGVMERSLSGHGWDVKSVDWHPTKGLIVSGSKDHLVKLWDPRTARCLTTLHGHKNTITKSKFQPTRGDLLATSARDNTCRIFDLRAMKDFCILRGHEKDISTLAWHPIHPALISTGGADGSLNHYLLDEVEVGVNKTSTAIVQPAHSISYAHEFAIWSMEYHPLGHILCTGSNDRITRFWVRPRPGEADAYKDRYHIGEAAAEAIGTHDRSRKRQMREEEEEAEDEENALIDQKMPLPGQQPSAPGLPTGSQKSTIPLPIIPGFPPPPVPGANGTVPGLGDLSALVAGGNISAAALGQLFPGGLPPPPPPPPGGLPGIGIPPGLPGMPPGIGGLPPPPVPLPQGMLPPGLVPPLPLPPGFPGIPGLPGLSAPPGIPGLGTSAPNIQIQDGGSGTRDGGAGRGAGRSRAPLPSQEESLREVTGGGGGGRRDPRKRNQN